MLKDRQSITFAIMKRFGSEQTPVLSLLLTGGVIRDTHNISAILFTNGDSITSTQGYTKVQRHLGLLCPLNEWSPLTSSKFFILSVIFLFLKYILSNINTSTTTLFLLLFSVHMIYLFLFTFCLFKRMLITDLFCSWKNIFETINSFRFKIM